ncbi:outer membrane protein assembly factor BamB family protein [Anatilimnocola aggregata]|nr:PQQ-binding-like beta-propeller repeat protein [Anatilimnocola aggregata]
MINASPLRSILLFLLLGPFAMGSVAFAQEKGVADFPQLSAENDWPWWRGPQRNGIAVGKAPIQFGDSQNVKWKVPVPGRGHSSPIVVGNKIFLTSADEAQQIHAALCFDRTTGKQLWQTEISRGGFPDDNHAKNTEATPSVACDGERLFVTFYHHEQVQATALDLNGKKLWQKFVGDFHPQRYEYGYAPSPILYQNTVIIAGEWEKTSFLAAFDRASGAEVWRTKRPSSISFSTPVIGHIAGKDQLLLSGSQQIASYDPATGKPLWTAAGCAAATCGTIVWDGDIVFASGGYPQSETIAVKADGSGQVVWKNNQKCYEQSMITTGGHLYALTDNGILFCWRASDGQEMWKQRLKGPVSSSPVLAGGHIYWANELGTHYVFKPNPERLEIVAENQLGRDSFASPAICGGQMFHRTAMQVGGKRQEFLFCLE